MNKQNESLHEFIRYLLSAVTNASLYSRSHPQVARLIDATYTNSVKLFESGKTLTIVCIDGELILNGQPQESSLFLNRLSEILTKNGISHLTLNGEVSRKEIENLVTALATNCNTKPFTQTTHIQVGEVDLKLCKSDNNELSDFNSDTKIETIHLLQEMPQEELDRFIEIYDEIKRRKQLKINGIAETVSNFVDAFKQQGDALLTMASLKETDEYTFTHSTNVCILTIAQAMAIGIEGQLLRDFGIAAMLHDIGKLFVPEEIITKKGSLTKEEFETMKQHPVLGARHLLNTPGVPRLAITTAYEHHLKFNLTGYPKVSSNWCPNLCSQMTMIADFFDAMRTRRSYREPVELQSIASMMLEMSGKDFHPVLTKNFLLILSRLLPKTL